LSVYGPLVEVGAEFLFQVIAERRETAAIILTTKLVSTLSSRRAMPVVRYESFMSPW
jgi:hypothetical protein